MDGPRIFGDLRNHHLLALLVKVDEARAEETREKGCNSPKHPGKNGRLHSADYGRKPRGAGVLSEEFRRRFSFCCSIDGCRRRTTPESLRFQGPKVYLGVAVVVVSALRCGLTPTRMQTLKELVGVSPQTVRRWLGWWRETLPSTKVWRSFRGSLSSAVQIDEMPHSVLERFFGSDLRRALLLLRQLGPLTGGRRSVAAAM